jgi:prevent-host-death family protein
VKAISATEASRRFSDVLDRAEHDGESFLIERNGRAVAEIRPAPRGKTVGSLRDFLRSAPATDSDFAADMREIVAARGSMPPQSRFPDS